VNYLGTDRKYQIAMRSKIHHWRNLHEQDKSFNPAID
jgi:hypothetical protein